ncbi:MAG: hypothetical protein ACLFWL_01715 [Candidatus Brocadiia bacterium]
MRKVAIVVSVLVMFIASCRSPEQATPEVVKPKSSFEGKTYYTNVNIWYEGGREDEIRSTNYHRGKILPAGTPVAIQEVNTDGILFELKESGAELKLDYVPRHTVLSVSEYFKRMFSEKNVLKEKDFTKEEMEAIEAGEVRPGMSKEAVIVAYGYPPSHETPALSANTWHYWISRWNRRVVEFKDGKVVETKK